MKKGRTRTILIADHDESVRSSLETALQPYCSELRLAASAADVLEILAALPVSLLLLELRLPVIDGLTILEKLERDRSEVRVVLLVDDALDGLISEARRHGAAGVIRRPVSVEAARRIVFEGLADLGFLDP